MFSFAAFTVLAIAAQSLFAGVDAAVLPKRQAGIPTLPFPPFNGVPPPSGFNGTTPSFPDASNTTFPDASNTTFPAGSGNITILPFPPFNSTVSSLPFSSGAPPEVTDFSPVLPTPTSVPAEPTSTGEPTETEGPAIPTEAV